MMKFVDVIHCCKLGCKGVGLVLLGQVEVHKVQGVGLILRGGKTNL